MGTPPPPRRAKTRAEKTKKKDILSDVLLGALEEIRTPDLLIRSQTLYPTELPAQVQDIYYHRHRGLSTVFAKKFEIFFAEQKKVLLPPSVGGRRALFSAADSPPAPPCVQGCACGPRGYPARTGVSLRGLWCSVHSAVPPCALRCPRAACGVPCTLRWPPCALRCPRCALGCPVRPGMPCAPCGVPARYGMPCAPWDAPMRPAMPHALWGAPCALGCPLPALGVSLARSGGVLCALQCSLYALAVPPARLRQPCGASRPAIQSAPLPCLATTLSPAPRRSSPPPSRTAEKKPGRSKRSGRALFISLSGDEAQVSDQALGLPNWQSLLPESEVHISSMFRGSL